MTGVQTWLFRSVPEAGLGLASLKMAGAMLLLLALLFLGLDYPLACNICVNYITK